jgi:hypothetical protein
MAQTYKIPVTWESYGHYIIEAENLEEAKEKALEPDRPLPDESNYIDDSIKLDDAEVITMMNESGYQTIV